MKAPAVAGARLLRGLVECNALPDPFYFSILLQLHHRLDILVELEEIGRIIVVLESDQPLG